MTIQPDPCVEAAAKAIAERDNRLWAVMSEVDMDQYREFAALALAAADKTKAPQEARELSEVRAEAWDKGCGAGDAYGSQRQELGRMYVYLLDAPTNPYRAASRLREVRQDQADHQSEREGER